MSNAKYGDTLHPHASKQQVTVHLPNYILSHTNRCVVHNINKVNNNNNVKYMCAHFACRYCAFMHFHDIDVSKDSDSQVRFNIQHSTFKTVYLTNE